MPTLACTATDINAKGVFVRTPDAHLLVDRSTLTIAFAIDLDGFVRLYELPVRVARITAEGVGLVLEAPANKPPVEVKQSEGSASNVIPFKRRNR